MTDCVEPEYAEDGERQDCQRSSGSKHQKLSKLVFNSQGSENR